MKAMIISVGGTPEPIVRSLLEHKPGYVCFFASQQSLDVIGDIKKQIKEKGLVIENYKVICDDVNDLIHCYEKALACKDNLLQKQIDSKDVVVDYTGGTKTMTAALTLATVGQGYRFSYVGGRERTKEGMGIVVTGTEFITTGVSPWQIFAVEEKKRIAQFISSYQYEAALTTMDETIHNLESGESEIWKGIMDTLRGYLAWDNFDHKLAITHLSNGLKTLSLCEKFGVKNTIKDYIASVKANYDVLNDMNKKTKYFSKVHHVLIIDLVSNAQRRYKQNKYDDATARLYRALEMVGQIAFETKTGCSTSDVNEEKLPDTIREEYKARYQSPDDKKIRIPLYSAFRVLKEMDHPAGHNFFTLEDTFKKILSARNDSIMAHGLNPISRKTYENFSHIIQELFVKGELIEFPVLQW
jgi:CRISPR-associated protein (TIGR02710 family)